MSSAQLVDLVLVRGNILTMDDARPHASALAIAQGRIVAVGDDAQIRALAGARTRIVDLGGRTVTPGFIDAHAHMEREGLKTLRPSLAHARTVNDVLDVVRAEAARLAKGEWIITMPVGEGPYYFGGPGNLAEGRMPTRWELDQAAPDHPVYIPGLFGNWGVPPGFSALNSLALARNNILPGTCPTCRGIEIEFDAQGEPTGIIVEHNKRPMLEFDLLSNVPAFSFDDRLEGLRRSLPIYHAYGTTSIYEGHGSAPQTLAVYRQLHQEQGLSMRSRLCVSPTWASPEEARITMRDALPHARGQGLGDDFLRIGGINLGMNGTADAAAASRRALPNTGWAGFVEWHNPLQDYERYALHAAENDLRVHSVVNTRLSDVLDAFERIDARYPLAGRRWVIEHIGHVEPADHARLRRLGLFITTNPLYTLWKNGAPHLQEPDDGNHYMPVRSLIENGFAVSAGSDNIPVNPFHAVWTCVTRRERTSGKMIGAGQRLNRLDALRMITSHGAWLSFEEQVKGTLTPGKFADLAVLSDNPLTVDDDALPQIHALLTLVGGKAVHGDLQAFSEGGAA